MSRLSLSLTGLLSLDRIVVGALARDKQDALSQALDLVRTHDGMLDHARAREAVLDRERTLSTGVGRGIALPHARTRYVDTVMAAVVTFQHPIAYDAIDGVPVQLLILLLSPEESRGDHIKLLSRVSVLVNDAAIRNQLMAAQSASDLYDVLVEGEDRRLNGPAPTRS